jgi:hypothetical protein
VTELVVIVPSRGRPETVAEMAAAFSSTCTASTRLLFAVDADDPALPAYQAAAVVHVSENPERTMVACLNRAARDVVMGENPYAIAFMGDDHRPRTKGWDTRYLEELRRLGTGLVYGNDLVQGERLPSQVAMTADIARALGWMAPPVLRHLYVDDFWRDLGVHAGCIRYLADVVVEHLHPVAGTAEMDAGYARVNAAEVYDADGAAYREFCASGAFKAAVDTVRALWPADTKRQRAIGMARASLVAEAAYITGGRTVADIAPVPTDLGYLLGPALQVRHSSGGAPADILCITGATESTVDCGAARAVVLCDTAGPPPGFVMLRSRSIGDCHVVLAVRR